MRIAILGAGAVGSVLGSLLWRAGEDVVLVGRAAHVAAIHAAGLDVQGVLGGFRATPRAEERLSSRPEVALLTVKAQDVAAALRDNLAFLDGVPIVVLQNGLAGEDLAASVVPRSQIVSGVVSLHVEYLKSRNKRIQRDIAAAGFRIHMGGYTGADRRLPCGHRPWTRMPGAINTHDTLRIAFTHDIVHVD